MTYISPNLRPHRRRTIRVEAVPYIPTSLGTRLLKVFGYMTVGAMAYGLVLMILFNLVTGCGEPTYYSDGTWMTGTCHPAFLFREDVQSVRGTW